MNKPHSIETLAFAYELHVEVETWAFIAEIVGGDPDTLRKAVYRLIHNGMKRAP